jgi:hypothetical protein
LKIKNKKRVMKTKDIFWYEEKIQDIKKRKRSLKMLMDPDLKKKIRKDLTKEKRSAKHSEKQTLKKYINEEIDNYVQD